MLKITHVTTTLSIMSTGLIATHEVKDFSISLPLLAGSYLGSFLPDIDNPNSKINHHVPILGHYLAHHHRGITHSLLALIILIGVIIASYQLPSNMITNSLHMYLIGLTIGYLIHLIEDDFSIQGVLWLYPLTKFKTSQNGYGHYKQRRFHRYFYYTGSRKETIIRWLNYPILLSLCYLMWLQH